MITIRQRVHFARGKAGRRRITSEPPTTETVPMGRVSRVSRLMALIVRRLVTVATSHIFWTTTLSTRQFLLAAWQACKY
jgi:hypothetical protein